MVPLLNRTGVSLQKMHNSLSHNFFLQRYFEI
jgi:hypothetical protein